MTTRQKSLHQEHDPLGRLLRILAGIVGVLFLLVGVGLFCREVWFGRIAQTAAGTVREVRVEENADGPNFYPVVEFTTQAGRIVRFEGTSTTPVLALGTAVSVLYNPAKPEEARINSFVQRWLFAAILIPTGLFMVLIQRTRPARRRETWTSFPQLSGSLLLPTLLMVTAGCGSREPATAIYSAEYVPRQLTPGQTQEIELTVRYEVRSNSKTATPILYKAQVKAPEGWSIAGNEWEVSHTMKTTDIGFRETRKLSVTIPADASRGEYVLKLLITPASGPAQSLNLGFQVASQGKSGGQAAE